MMPRERVTGRRHSKIREVSYGPEDDLSEVVEALGAFNGFEELIKEKVAKAGVFLASKGLPTSARLGYSKSAGEWRPVDDLMREDLGGGRYLDDHVLGLGFERDSFEHLAASFIVAVEWMGHADRAVAIRWAYRAGQISALARVYGVETSDRRKGGRKRKRRHWAEEVAARIGGWHEIPESTAPLAIEAGWADLIVYRDDERVVCEIDGGKADSLAKRTFLERYFYAGRRRGHLKK